MQYVIRCHSCNEQLLLSDKSSGQGIKCPKCGVANPAQLGTLQQPDVPELAWKDLPPPVRRSVGPSQRADLPALATPVSPSRESKVDPSPSAHFDAARAKELLEKAESIFEELRTLIGQGTQSGVLIPSEPSSSLRFAGSQVSNNRAESDRDFPIQETSSSSGKTGTTVHVDTNLSWWTRFGGFLTVSAVLIFIVVMLSNASREHDEQNSSQATAPRSSSTSQQMLREDDEARHRRNVEEGLKKIEDDLRMQKWQRDNERNAATGLGSRLGKLGIR